MNIFPKQRNFIYRKGIFFITTQNKNETVALNTKDKKSRGYINDELSRTDNIANNASNVNNTDTKFSRDVNIDEFDERDYNVINTTGLRGYASLKHEVMTWDDIKYLNQVRCISIEDRFYLYKMLDNETRDIIIYKAKKRTRSEYNAIRRAYGRKFNGNTVSISELIESNRNGSNDNSNIFRHEQGKLDNNDKFDNQKIRAKRESNGRGIAENGNNDNLSEEKYSRNVDYAEGVLLFLIKSAYINKKEDETLFKTGNGQKTTPSNASSSIYSLLNKLQNVNNTDTKFSLDVDRFSNDLRIHTMYAKNKGNNDDTANAKALASTSETSVGNVPFNSSISKYSDNVKKFSLDVDRFLND